MVAVASDCQRCKENEDLKSLSKKLLSLFESQFEGGEDDKPAKLISFLD
jgi:hypothetical protein